MFTRSYDLFKSFESVILRIKRNSQRHAKEAVIWLSCFRLKITLMKYDTFLLL